METFGRCRDVVHRQAAKLGRRITLVESNKRHSSRRRYVTLECWVHILEVVLLRRISRDGYTGNFFRRNLTTRSRSRHKSGLRNRVDWTVPCCEFSGGGERRVEGRINWSWELASKLVGCCRLELAARQHRRVGIQEGRRRGSNRRYPIERL